MIEEIKKLERKDITKIKKDDYYSKYFEELPDERKTELPMTEKEKENIRLLATHKISFKKIPEEERTELVSYVAAITNPQNRKALPKANRSRRVILKALSRCGETILNLDKDEITKGMLEYALKHISENGGEVLRLFPDKMKTYKTCLAAVQKSSAALMFVPEEHRSAELCEKAILSLNPLDESGEGITYYITNSDVLMQLLPLLTEKFETLNIIDCINPKTMNVEIAEWLVKDTGECINSIPQNLQTEKLLNIALKKLEFDEIYWKNIRADIIKPGIFEQAIKTSSEYFRSIPKDKLTPELCLLQQTQYPFEFYCANLPEAIKNTCNPFSLNRKIYELMRIDLSYAQTMKLYQGEKVSVMDKKTKQRRVFSFDPKHQKVSIKPDIFIVGSLTTSKQKKGLNK